MSFPVGVFVTHNNDLIIPAYSKVNCVLEAGNYRNLYVFGEACFRSKTTEKTQLAFNCIYNQGRLTFINFSHNHRRCENDGVFRGSNYVPLNPSLDFSDFLLREMKANRKHDSVLKV